MKERVAAAVVGIDAPAQIVPVADFVHGLVADDLFQDRRRRGPVDPAQNQKAAVEPRPEQMGEVPIDHGQIAVLTHEFKQLGAHGDQRGGAAGRAIEPAEQFLPARLGGVVNFARGRLVAVRIPSRHRLPHPLAIGSEFVCERAKDRNLVGSVEGPIAAEKFARERDPQASPRPVSRAPHIAMREPARPSASFGQGVSLRTERPRSAIEARRSEKKALVMRSRRSGP